ncbi:MAG: hypothetical protein LAT76_08195 [Schleiferiaceae bacterium]|nr:hypothetical protein [Schleiferiaceae bacterium]
MTAVTLLKRCIAFALVLAVIGCGDNRDNCSSPGALLGIAERSLSITCFPDPSNGEYVVQSNAQLDALFEKSNTAGIPCNLQEIDFETHTLLGFYTVVKGCDARFNREVEKVETLRRYIFRVTVDVCSPCEDAIFSYNWVLVPKLPPGYTVDFIRE